MVLFFYKYVKIKLRKGCEAQMKTIKFILNTDGSIVSPENIGFQINQYSYNDTLINVYVPNEILNNLPQTSEVDSDNSDITYLYTYGNNIVMAMYYTLANGSQKLGNPYYFTFVKNNIVIDGKTYTLFERKMPREFTFYYGTQNYAINVIATRNTLTTDNSVNPPTTTSKDEIIGNVTTSNFELTINQSLNMADNPIEVDTDLSTLIADVNTLMEAIIGKQDKQDGLIHVAIANGSPTFTTKVVEALNYLNLRVRENYTTNGTQDGDISNLSGRVTTLEQEAITGFRYLGTNVANDEPSSADLNAYASSLGVVLKNGDIVIWIYQQPDTDQNYRCIYSTTDGWSWYEIPPMELAGNYSAGVIQGTYSNLIPMDYWYDKIYCDIQGGRIKDIYYRTADDSLVSINTELRNITTNIANIVSGSQQVGKAEYATYDSTEENKLFKTTINDKFMTNEYGATRQYVQNYALPREFNDVYELKLGVDVGGTLEDIFSNSDGDVATLTYKTTSLSLGDNTCLSATMTLNEDVTYTLSKKNSYKLYLNVAFTNNITDVGMTLNIYWKPTNDTHTLLASTSLDRTDYDTNTHKLLFADYFNRLDDVGMTITSGDGYYEFEVICNTTTSATNDITIHSTTSVESTFSLSTDSYTLCTSQSGIVVHEKYLTLDDNVLFAELGSIALADKTQHQFILHLPVGVSWNDLPKNCYFDIQIDGVSIEYTINKKLYSDNYVGNFSQFLNIHDTFNFVATCLDDGFGSFYFDIVSEDNIGLYITRAEDIEYDSVEDKYYISNEYMDMLINKVCIVDFNTLGIVNDFPPNTLLRLKHIDNINMIYSFDYAEYDDNTQQITNYNIKLLYDGDNNKWYFVCGKNGIYTQSSVNSLLNAKADLTNNTQVITADKVKVNEIRDITGSGNVKTTYSSSDIMDRVENPNDSNHYTYSYLSQIFSEMYYRKGANDYSRMQLARATSSLESHFVDDATQYMPKRESNSFVGILNYPYMTYSYSENDVNLVNNYFYLNYDGFRVHVNSNVLKVDRLTNKLTYNYNEVIDTNNATTELFLTDAEMTTLLSEVFD